MPSTDPVNRERKAGGGESGFKGSTVDEHGECGQRAYGTHFIACAFPSCTICLFDLTRCAQMCSSMSLSLANATLHICVPETLDFREESCRLDGFICGFSGSRFMTPVVTWVLIHIVRFLHGTTLGGHHVFWGLYL